VAVKNVIFRLQAETGNLRTELDQIKKKVGGIGDETERTEKQFGGLTGTIKKVGLALAGLAIGREIFQFGKSAITAAADFEALEIAFTTFLGSSKEAKKVLQDLEDLSVSTPFTPEQVQNAGKALLAFGVEVDNLQPSLKKIGDLSAGTGKDFNQLAVIFGKAKVQGTLFAEDINQLTEAGIPVIQEFAKQLGVSEGQVKKLGSEGKISFANLETAFADLTGEGGKFFGLTDALSGSTSGRISTLEGNFGLLKREIGNGLLPIFESLLNVAFKVVDVFSNFGTFLDRNRVAVALFASTIGILVGALTRQKQISLLNTIQTQAATLAEKAARLARIARITATRNLTKVTQQNSIASKASTIASLTATSAVRAFSAAIKANPIGLLITGISLAASLFLDFGDAAEDAAGATGDLGDETTKLSRKQIALNTVRDETIRRTADEAAELKLLINQVKNTNQTQQERGDIIDTINSKYGLTLKNLSDEKKFIEQLDVAYSNFVETLKKKIFLEVKQEELTTLIKEQITLEEQLAGVIAPTKGKTFGQRAGESNLFGVDLTDEDKIAPFEKDLQQLKTLASKSKEELDEIFKDDAEAKFTGIDFKIIRSEVEEFAKFSEKQKKQFEDNARRTRTAIIKRNEEIKPLLDNPLGIDPNEAIPEFDFGTGFVKFDPAGEGELKGFQQITSELFGVNEAIAALEGDFENFDFGEAFGGSGGPKITASKIKSILLDLQTELRKAQEKTRENQISFIDPVTLDDEIDKLKKAAVQAKLISANVVADRIKTAKKAGQLGANEAKLFAQINAEQQLQIEEKLQESIADLRDKAKKKRSKTEFDIETTEQTIEFETTELDEFKLIEEEKKKIKEQLKTVTDKEERQALKEQLKGIKDAEIASLTAQTDFKIKQIERERDFELDNAALTAEERILIEKNADLEILRLRSALGEKTDDLNESGTEAAKKAEADKKQVILDGIADVLNATKDLIDQIIELQIAEVENAISAQEKRVEAATELAEKGNAELLEAEERRLEELNKKKAKFVRTQQALAATELIINSVVAVSKAAAEGGAAAPFTIAATLIALAAGLVAAKAQASAAAGGFASGGYTGDGGKYQSAGIVHKGEFVMTKEQTSKFRPYFEEIHKGRNPFLTEGLNEKFIFVNNFGFESKLDRIEKAISNQDRMKVNIDERGINAIVSNISYKQQRIKNRAR